MTITRHTPNSLNSDTELLRRCRVRTLQVTVTLVHDEDCDCEELLSSDNRYAVHISLLILLADHFCQKTWEIASQLINEADSFDPNWLKMTVGCQSSLFGYLLLGCYATCSRLINTGPVITYLHSASLRYFHILPSVVVLEESPCHRGFSRTNLQVLVLGPQVLVLGPQVLENCQGLRILQTVYYDWWHDVHEFDYHHHAWRYGEECLTYWCQVLFTDKCQ